MIRKEFKMIAIILFIVFAGITIVKYTGNASSGHVSSDVINRGSAQTFWMYYNHATKYRLKNKIDSSITFYHKALKLNPDHKDALYYIGNMYMKAGMFGKAQETWVKLIGLNSQSERGYNQLGNLYFCIEHKNYFKPEKAKWYFTRANELNKEALNPKKCLGEIALFQNRKNDAYGIFNKLLMMEHENAEIYFLVGYINWKAHKYQNATKNLEYTFEYANSLHISTGENKNKILSTKKVFIGEKKECDFFAVWLKQHLFVYKLYDVRIAMPKVYNAFDHYISELHKKMNPG
jgi:tetratricopeptide (TPR) repeat protein